MLLDLPDIIYTLFKSYLSNGDFIQLVSSSQRYFKEIRRGNIYFRLDGSKSERFCVDESYRDYIHSRVSRLDRQISMSLSIDLVQKYKDLLAVYGLSMTEKEGHADYSLPLLPAKVISLSLPLIKDITSLSEADDVFIHGCNGITDISALKDVRNVTIFCCENIRNFFCLGKQKTLDFYSCPNLTNVQSFSGLQKLEIDNCENLIDVSPLHGIPFLSITYCSKVEDISVLGNHKHLNISRCAYALKGYDILETVQDTSLNFCDIADVSMMKSARSVNLQNVSNLKDVSSLANVKRLTLINCPGIEDISMLNKVRVLHLGLLATIRRYEGVEHHPHLTITCYQIEEEMEALTKLCSAVCNLYLDRINFSAFVILLPSFSRLMLLSIKHDEEFELQGFEDIHTVELRFCSKITSTKGLGRNREVIIVGCNKMNDVSHLANVPIVKIRYCQKVVDVSCLVSVPRLEITACGVN